MDHDIAIAAVAYLPHSIDCIVSELFNQIPAFLESDTMFASNGSFHLNRTFAHTVDDLFGSLLLSIIV